MDVVNALTEVCSESDCLLFTAIPKEEKDFEVESPHPFVSSVQDCLASTSSADEVMQFAGNLSENDKVEIERQTRGHADNEQWFRFRKHVITASKAHDVKTRMETAQREEMESTDFKAVCEKVSESSKINPNIPALKYGRAIEGEAVSTFMELYAKTHKNATVFDCGPFRSKKLSFVGGSPDRILRCDCCGHFCLEIKCSASISHTSP